MVGAGVVVVVGAGAVVVVVVVVGAVVVVVVVGAGVVVVGIKVVVVGALVAYRRGSWGRHPGVVGVWLPGTRPLVPCVVPLAPVWPF